MDAAAITTLSADDFRLDEALMSFKASVEKHRTKLAHGIFGITSKCKSGVVWIDTTRYAQYGAKVSLHGVIDELYKEHLSHCRVYELGDLETIAREIEDLHAQIGFFTGYLGSSDAAFRAKRYLELCAEPRVQKELDRLDQKKSQGETPQSPPSDPQSK